MSVLSQHLDCYQGFCFAFCFVIPNSDAMKMSPDKCLLRFFFPREFYLEMEYLGHKGSTPLLDTANLLQSVVCVLLSCDTSRYH